MNEHPHRRAFVLGTAAAVASSRLAATSQEIRVGMIGVGNRGTSLLKQVLAKENTKVTAISDIDPQALDRGLSLAARDNPRSVTEWRKLVDMKEVDAVFVSTPCDLHAEMSIVALDAGKPVYCEKPLGVTPEQVAAVLRAARRSSAFLQIGQQLRYFPTMREIMRRIHDEKILGRTFVIKAQRHSTPSRPSEARVRPAWYLDVKRSGDLIVENAVHNIDACNWIADSRPVSAFGHGMKYLPEPQPAGTAFMDGFSVQYIYENKMHLDYSQLYLHPRMLKEVPNGQWYLVFGEKGSVFFTYSSAMFYDMHGDSEPLQLLGPKFEGAREDAVGDFLACIREKRQPFADVKVGAVAALTAIMGREAIYRGRSVTWKELGVSV